MELLRRYSNRPDLLKPLLDVLRRVEEEDQEDEPGVRSAHESDPPLRVADRLGEAGVRELIERSRAGVTQLELATRYGISVSSVKRLLREHRNQG